MSLRYKISLLATASVLAALVPLSLIHTRALAQAEEMEIQARLRAMGKLMATEVFVSDLGSGSEARQTAFLKAAQATDKAILFTAVYPGAKGKGIAVVNRARFPGRVKGADWELIRRLVDQHSDPTVHYVSVALPGDKELLMGYSVDGIHKRRRRRQLQAVGWAVGLTALAVAGSMFFAQRVTRPIRDLADGMSRVAAGDLNTTLGHWHRDEIGALTRDFNQMVADLRENVLERQRMSQELEIARRIQQRLLPQSEPEVPGLDVAGICLTYAEVGGDYYDYLSLDDGRLAVAMGDVSGHGVSSGLLAAAVYGCLRNQVTADPEPVEVLAAVDRVVRSFGDQLMTLCYTVLDPSNGRATVASAGHWAPCHYSARTGAVEEVYPPTAIAPVLGSFPIEIYPDHLITLESGDILAIYSDGIPETLDSDKDMYGEERFHSALSRHAGGNAKQIRDAILDEVSHFRGEMPQHDDIALVILKIEPPNQFEANSSSRLKPTNQQT